MKKLITIAWTSTVEADVPENTNIDNFDDLPEDLQCEIIKNASDNLNAKVKNGVVAGVQDVEIED